MGANLAMAPEVVLKMPGTALATVYKTEGAAMTDIMTTQASIHNFIAL